MEMLGVVTVTIMTKHTNCNSASTMTNTVYNYDYKRIYHSLCRV